MKINKNKQKKLDTVGKEKYAQKHDFLRRFQEKVASKASKMVLMRKKQIFNEQEPKLLKLAHGISVENIPHEPVEIRGLSAYSTN